MSPRRRTAPAQRPRVRGWFLAEPTGARGRGGWLVLAFAAMAVTVSVRLIDVQVRQGSRLAAMAAAQHITSVPLPAHRGRILDRSGSVLVSDVPVYSVWADPGVIPPEQRHDVAAALAPVLGQGPGRIESLLSQSTRFVYLAHQVDEATKQKLSQLAIYGIGASPEEERSYQKAAAPNVSFASNLIGYVDHDGHGQYGVEGYYDSVLRGQAGSESTLRDLSGNAIVLDQQQRQDPQNGRDLQLGLDSQVQYWAEEALAKGVNDAQAESGTLLVMDTKTGSIRAWADYPSYDASQFASSNPGNVKDSAIADLYEPGSVMKVVTFAGALDHHVITPQTVIDEHQQNIQGYVIHDWDGKDHGKVTTQWVLDDSLNNGAIDVMRMLGPDAYYQNLLAFGIGSPTGVDLAGEQAQPLRPQSQWKEIDYATASFGQQVQVTPIEMLASINAVANGGVWVQPHAVDAVVDPATGRSVAFTPQSRRVIAPDTAATLSKMMTGVVEDRGASGFLAKIPSFKGLVAGKTGTASVPVNGVYGSDIIASYVGFMPTDHPQFTMLVVLRKPHENRLPHEGAFLAAPVWKEVALFMIDTWRILP